MNPQALLDLANLGRPRRLAGVRAKHAEEPLNDLESARRQIGHLVSGPIEEGSMPQIRALWQAVDEIAKAIEAGRPWPIERINRLAERLSGHPRVERTGQGRVVQHFAWTETGAGEQLLLRVISELVGTDPRRLRVCARKECSLLFYDDSRSGTRRWHAESPCGLRERQARHRVAAKASHVRHELP